MGASAETIIVAQERVICAGRAGDLCLLKKGGSEIKTVYRNVESVLPSFLDLFMRNMLGRQNLQSAGHWDEDQQDDESE